MAASPLIRLDLILPVYNESETLPLVFERLMRVFSPKSLLENGLECVRFIFVDDGSSDSSAAQIRDQIARGFPAVLLRLSRNFGHQNAVSAGMAKTQADVVAIIDADLQDPPEVILEMLAKWRTGADVVYGVRRKRKENFLKRSCYWLYYRLLSALSEIDIPKDSGDFCLMDRRVVEALASLPERQRFARGLRAWVGFRQVGMDYERQCRAAGLSKYPFKDLYRLATDGIVSLSMRPLKLVQLSAFIFALFFLFCFALTSWWILEANTNGIEVWFLIAYTLMSLSAFFILGSLFIICGYLGRMFFEVKARPSFIIMEEIDSQSLSLAEGERTPSRAMKVEWAT